MRTTLILNDELVAAAKQEAAERQCSLSVVINDALRLSLSSQPRKSNSRRFRLPCYRGNKAVAGMTPEEFAESLDSEELESFRK